jgi:hypothetical protein
MMKYRNLSMTAIAVALVAANAVTYAAQEGVRWTHLGEVRSITGNRLVMTQSQGQEKSFTMTTDAKVTLDGRTIVADDLKPGTKIRVTTTKEDQNAVRRIEAIDKRADFVDSFRDGNLVSITGSQLVMASMRGRKHSHTLAADAELILDGKVCEAADLKPGMKIRATTEGADQSVVNRIEAIDKNSDFASSSREGGLFGGTDNQLAQPRTNVRMETEGTSQNVTDRSDAIDQRPDAARTQQDGTPVAINRLDGKVVSVTDNRLVMKDRQGQEHSSTLTADAKCTLDGKACQAADLKPGTRICVTTCGADQSEANRIEGIDKNPDFASSSREGGRSGGTDNQLVQPRTSGRMATEGTNQNVTDRSGTIDQRSDAAKTQQEGKLVSITGDRLVMTGARANAERTCTLATDVRVTCDGRPCKSEDLRPGMRIRVTTESKAPHKTIRIEALDKNVEFASL